MPWPPGLGTPWGASEEMNNGAGVPGENLKIYDPGNGQVVEVSRTDFVAGTFEVAGWDRAWATAVP